MQLVFRISVANKTIDTFSDRNQNNLVVGRTEKLCLACATFSQFGAPTEENYDFLFDQICDQVVKFSSIFKFHSQKKHQKNET